MNREAIVRRTAFVLLLGAVVIVPFFIFGEELAQPWIDATGAGRAWIVATAILLLTVDAALPVPSSIVLIMLANRAGPVAGVVGGAIGLTAGVLVAAWIGRAAVGPVASRLVPAGDLERLRTARERQVMIALVCLRSIPILAEMSVLAAAAAKVPMKRILWATVPANVVIAVVYSFAADESLGAAAIAFFVTVAVSYLVWRWSGRGAAAGGTRARTRTGEDRG